MSDELTDIGDFLAVPEEERLDVDPAPEYNADAGFDVQVVPDGEYRELSTSAEEEPIAAESKRTVDEGDGAPLEWLSPGEEV
jgi:hypothetical protein